MAAATTAIVALGGLALTGYQMYEADKSKKEADQAAKAAANKLKNIKEVNQFEAVQTPDISSLAFEKIAQSEAAGIEALQGAGQAGAAQVTNLVNQGRTAALDVAQQQAILENQRDVQEATAGQEIEQRRAGTERMLEMSRMQGAQQAAADAEAQLATSTAQFVQGVGGVATGVGSATSLEAKAQRNQKKTGTTPSKTTGTTSQSLGSITTSGLGTGFDEYQMDPWGKVIYDDQTHHR